MFKPMSSVTLLASLWCWMLHHQDSASIQAGDLKQTALHPCMTSQGVRHRGRSSGTLLWNVSLEWVQAEIRSHLGKRLSP